MRLPARARCQQAATTRVDGTFALRANSFNPSQVG